MIYFLIDIETIIYWINSTPKQIKTNYKTQFLKKTKTIKKWSKKWYELTQVNFLNSRLKSWNRDNSIESKLKNNYEAQLLIKLILKDKNKKNQLKRTQISYSNELGLIS
jgi:hypothetical protein